MTELWNRWVSAELAVLDYISVHFTNDFLDAVLPFLTSLCNHGEIWILMALVFLLFAGTRHMGAAMFMALFFGFVAGNVVLKPLVARVRPYELAGVALLVPPLADFSFPSGHTLASFAASGVLMFTDKRFGIPALVFAAVIAFSRLYLYVHFPTDVAAGILLGLVFAALAVRLTARLERRFPAVFPNAARH